MKYYIFSNGTLKTDLALKDLLLPGKIADFKELTKTQYFKNRSAQTSKSAYAKVKAACAVVKTKAVAVKDVF